MWFMRPRSSWLAWGGNGSQVRSSCPPAPSPGPGPGKEVQHPGPREQSHGRWGVEGKRGLNCAKAEAGLEYCFRFCGICQLFKT